MAKSQFQSTEILRVRFPAFINKTTTDFIVGTDICTITVKKPDSTTQVFNDVSSPAVTFDADAEIWKLDIPVGSFQSGEWLVLAESNDANALSQRRSYIWGDYVNDITVAASQATIAAKIAGGRWKIQGTQLILYDDDNITPLYTFDLKDDTGAASATKIFERFPV